MSNVAFEIGRIVVKSAGRELARKGVILGFVDKNFVLITGAKISSVRRRKSNLKHLIPTDKQIKIKENASDEDVTKALDKAKLRDFFVKEFEFGID